MSQNLLFVNIFHKKFLLEKKSISAISIFWLRSFSMR